jgi:hypothetical protein
VNLEQLGLFGVFLAGAIPWFEAIGVVPVGIIFGLNPIWVVIFALVGNTLTIVLFAYAGAGIRSWFIRRRELKGKPANLKRFEKAQRSFDKYGIFGMGALGPIIIGTQFAAAASVAAGVKPLKTSLIITAFTAVYAAAFAVLSLLLGADQLLQ